MADVQHRWRRCREDYETYLRLERGMADNSVKAYMQDFDNMQRFMCEQDVAPESVAREHLQQLLKQLCDLGIAPASQRRMISGWRMFFHMMVIDDIVKDNPAALLDLPIKPHHLPDVLTDDEVTAIQQTFDRSLPEGERNYVIVEVLYGCGLRVSELVNLKLSNIYVEEQYLQVIGKGDIVVYESTVYPGVTEDECLPVVERVSGLNTMSISLPATVLSVSIRATRYIRLKK
jgi:integrase/recombinase XerD